MTTEFLKQLQKLLKAIQETNADSGSDNQHRNLPQ